MTPFVFHVQSVVQFVSRHRWGGVRTPRLECRTDRWGSWRACGRRLLAVAAGGLLALGPATAGAAELSAEVTRLADWAVALGAGEQAVEPGVRRYTPPPQVTVADRPALEQVTRDVTRKPTERMAALALLGMLDTTERGAAIRAFFKETYARLAAHVVYAEEYVSALQPQGMKDTQGRPKRAPQARAFGAFVPADLPLLARMALLEQEGMAMAALGLTGDERAVDVLVLAPFVGLGSRRRMGNANYQGLWFLCREPTSRRWVSARLGMPGLSDPRRAILALALAMERDPAALDPLIGLIRALTAPPGIFASDPERLASDPKHTILPPGFQPRDVMWICKRWGEPRLGEALAEYVYSGRGATDEGFAAAKACRVTLAKERVFALAFADARDAARWDAGAVLRALEPLLEASDAPAVARLLAPPEWRKQSFYHRVLWIPSLRDLLLTPEVRDAVIQVARTHTNPVVREWGIQALRRFHDAETDGFLRDAEAHGAQAATRILCERDKDPGEAFMRRFADPNPAVCEAAFGLVKAQFFGNSNDNVPGGLTPEKRAVILARLLADWPTEAAPERVEEMVQRLYMLVIDGELSKPAARTPELAAAVAHRADQLLAGPEGAKHAYRLLTVWLWVHTPEARQTVERLRQETADAGLRTKAEEILQKWGP